MTLGWKGGVVNSLASIAVAQALIKKSADEHIKFINLISSIWTQSLFQRMGFVRRMRTTDKLEIPHQAVMKAKLLFQNQIACLVEKNNILPNDDDDDDDDTWVNENEEPINNIFDLMDNM